MSPDLDRCAGLAAQLARNVSLALRGRDGAIEAAMICLLAGGHLLVEDVPGVGKTTLASAFAKSLGIGYRRIQFTSDMMPSDILGVNTYDPRECSFTFRNGPIFTNVLLADEINRAEPRVQSALLEAMFEGQVTTDGETRELPSPFMVIATQNPVDFSGTFPLPDSQLDRFMLRISMGYPSHEFELEILKQTGMKAEISPVWSLDTISFMSSAAATVYASDEILNRIIGMAHATRNHRDIAQGASTRAMTDLLKASKARALIHHRDYVLPDDIDALAPSALAHRIRMAPGAYADPHEIIKSI